MALSSFYTYFYTHIYYNNSSIINFTACITASTLGNSFTKTSSILLLVTQGNSPVTTTRVGTVIMVNKAWLMRIRRRGEKLKVPHHASTAAAHDGNLPYSKGNLPYTMATCLYS